MPNGKPKRQCQCYVFSLRWSVQNIADHNYTDLCRVFSLLAEKYIFQLEDTTDNLHYQCFARWKKKQYAKTLAKRLHEQFHGIEVRPCSENGKLALSNYCMKSESRVAGPFADRPIYLGQDLNCMRDPHPWQTRIMKMLDKDPDDRTIHWIYNREGNVGKSKLCKYLKFHKKWKRIPLGTATQLKTNAVTKGPFRAYYVDLPRVKGKEEAIQDLMSAIEDIKNGDVESAMYGKINEMQMVSPHVFVFSNDVPPINLATRDRWKVYTITDMKLKPYNPYIEREPGC